jgi:hypothetical protein
MPAEEDLKIQVNHIWIAPETWDNELYHQPRNNAVQRWHFVALLNPPNIRECFRLNACLLKKISFQKMIPMAGL